MIKACPPTKETAPSGATAGAPGEGRQVTVKLPALKPDPIVALVPGHTP